MNSKKTIHPILGEIVDDEPVVVDSYDWQQLGAEGAPSLIGSSFCDQCGYANIHAPGCPATYAELKDEPPPRPKPPLTIRGVLRRRAAGILRRLAHLLEQ